MAFVSSGIPHTSDRYTGADWIELQAIEAISNNYQFSKVYRMIDILDDVDDRVTDDSASTDYAEVDGWLDELKFRKRTLGNSYPFNLTTETIEYINVNTEECDNNSIFGCITYLLSLLFTHANSTDVLQGKDLLDLKNNVKDREMFQICSTIAAAGYLSGSSVSFGYPRADKTKFLDALNKMVGMIFDGAKIKRMPHPSAPTSTKDFEIDIVSWIPTNDSLPSKTIMIGQVATGETNWKSKNLCRDQFLKINNLWLEERFGSDRNLTTALFIPFCIRPTNKDATLASELHSGIGENISNTIFYRCRTPYYVQKLFDLVDSNAHNFSNLNKIEGVNFNISEGVNDFNRVEKYVLKKITSIKGE